jgi:signal peptidase I
MRMPPWAGVVGAAALALAIGGFFGGTHAYVVPSDSMIPTLLRGDEFRAETWNTESRRPKRGEIWVFHNPRQTDDTGPILVKRVVGLPGETISVRKGQLVIDDQPQNEKYCKEPIRYPMKPVHLGADQYWMLGDNRNHSGDSHEWGPLSRRLLIGHAFVRYWPPARFAWL